MIAALAPALERRLAAGEAVIIVAVIETMGSTPREAGATMLVGETDATGSIGGGQLEFHAIDIAREMIAQGRSERRLDIPLGPNLGQCCGGRVVLSLERAGARHLEALRLSDARRASAAPAALVFGAGHTGRALARMLALVPLKTQLIDEREGVFDGLPQEIDCRRADDPEHALADAPPRAAFVILTHSHALDYALADAALRRGDAAYVGMIGSATKRVRFEKWRLQRGGSREQLSRLTCPIGGGGVRDKRPEIIAALTAAEVARALFGRTDAPSIDETFDGRAA